MYLSKDNESLLNSLNRYRCDVGYSSICCAIAGVKDISIKTIMIYILFMILLFFDVITLYCSVVATY